MTRNLSFSEEEKQSEFIKQFKNSNRLKASFTKTHSMTLSILAAKLCSSGVSVFDTDTCQLTRMWKRFFLFWIKYV